MRFVNAEVAFVNVSLAQAGIARQMVDYVLALLRSKSVAFGQRICIRTCRPLLDIRMQLVKILFILRGKLFVVPRRACVCGEKKNEWKIITRRAISGLKIQNAGNQHDAVECDAVLHQIAGESGGTRGAVAFSHHKERRCPALISAQVETNEFTNRFNIILEPKEFLGLVAFHGATVAGTYRINETTAGTV